MESVIAFLKKIFFLFLDQVLKEPDRPTEKYPRPDIIKVKGAKYKTQGNYRTKSGMAKGLVVHYTVSGKSDDSARAVVKYLARKGLGCAVMDEHGTIYVAENFDIEKDVAWHAGSSSWQGHTGMSRYCIGMEICNWGRLTPESRKRVSKMRKANPRHNIKAGDYEPYTPAQEEALVNFILWYKQINPDFDVDFVIGHDECAPTRKSDPGASLSKSMPEFREYLKKRLMEA